MHLIYLQESLVLLLGKERRFNVDDSDPRTFLSEAANFVNCSSASWLEWVNSAGMLAGSNASGIVDAW